MSWGAPLTSGLPEEVYTSPIFTALAGLSCANDCGFCGIKQRMELEPNRYAGKGKSAILYPEHYLAFYRVMRDTRGARSALMVGYDPFGPDNIARETSFALMDETLADGNYFSAVTSGVGVDDEVIERYARHERATLFFSIDDVWDNHDRLRKNPGLFEHCDEMIGRMCNHNLDDQIIVTSIMFANEDLTRLRAVLEWLSEIAI